MCVAVRVTTVTFAPYSRDVANLLQCVLWCVVQCVLQSVLQFVL